MSWSSAVRWEASSLVAAAVAVVVPASPASVWVRSSSTPCSSGSASSASVSAPWWAVSLPGRAPWSTSVPRPRSRYRPRGGRGSRDSALQHGEPDLAHVLSEGLTLLLVLREAIQGDLVERNLPVAVADVHHRQALDTPWPRHVRTLRRQHRRPDLGAHSRALRGPRCVLGEPVEGEARGGGEDDPHVGHLCRRDLDGLGVRARGPGDPGRRGHVHDQGARERPERRAEMRRESRRRPDPGHVGPCLPGLSLPSNHLDLFGTRSCVRSPLLPCRAVPSWFRLPEGHTVWACRRIAT